jgi:sulfite reductase (NADPH) flavoprotein alpha-component
VATYNQPGAGYRLIINGRVYDVSEFGQMHPGGSKIIQSYAGLDATFAYQKVQHDVNPEVDSLLGMYEIGAVRRLNFGPAWGMAVTPKGLQYVALADLYAAWLRLLYAVVEMENALLNDYSIRAEQVTYDETRGAARPSLYRAQLLLQTHARCRRDYVAKATGPALAQLWALTSALCSDQHDYRWLPEQVALIEAGPAAQAVRALGETAQERLSAAGDPAVPPSSELLAWFTNLTDLLAEEDRRFLYNFKLALQRGAQVFENYEAQTLTRGRRELLEVVQQLPGVLAAYYELVAGRASD